VRRLELAKSRIRPAATINNGVITEPLSPPVAGRIADDTMIV
jgi:hypothetical protein